MVSNSDTESGKINIRTQVAAERPRSCLELPSRSTKELGTFCGSLVFYMKVQRIPNLFESAETASILIFSDFILIFKLKSGDFDTGQMR